MSTNPYSSGDKVYINGDDRVFVVHTVYNDTEVSLGLADYSDVEQDYLTDISVLTRVEDI
jgi:hypothetical protein